MQVAVSSQNRKTVTGHARRCSRFWLYELSQAGVSGKRLIELLPGQHFHHSSAIGAHPLLHINAVISAGMGQRLSRRFMQQGIRSLVTAETDPDMAVAVLLQGQLSLWSSDELCSQGSKIEEYLS